MANSGTRPTVAGGSKKMIFEAHLFDFSGGLYGKTLKVRLLRKLRDEKTFGSLADLSRQLEKDRAGAEKICYNIPHAIDERKDKIADR